MKIGFDLQALQTTSKNRGIGRYSINLVEKMLEIGSEHDFKLFTNANLDEKVEIKLNDKSELIHIKYKNGREAQVRIANNFAQFFNYRKRDLDVFYILSTFEGHPINDAVINPYFERLDSIVCATLYDFIPIRYSEFYLSNPVIREVIYRQLKIVYHCDVLFAISEATRQDAINLFGINPNKVVNIGGSASDSFYHIDNLSENKLKDLKKKYGIKKKFVLYVGGIEFRKNVERSISAFSKINKSILEETSYVIVCSVNEIDKKRLTEYCTNLGMENNVVLTGYLPDEEVNLLYNCCDVFLFPSLMEGLGLPILEAMKCGAPVICSNTSSMAELVEDKQFMFNPDNELEIAELTETMLTDHALRKKSVDHSLKRSHDFSWEISAKKVLTKLESQTDELRKKKLTNLIKPRIAFFSPLPPKKSGISYYSAALLPLLSKYWDVDIFIDNGYVCDDSFLTTNFEIYSYLEFEDQNQKKKYDCIIYQIGNSDNHTYMFDVLAKHPGVVVLHDVYLSGIVHWNTVRVGKIDEFINEVVYSHGEDGRKLVEKAQKNLISWDHVLRELQINKRVLDNATWIILHSEWDKENITKSHPEYLNKISLVHQFAPIREQNEKDRIKMSLGFSNNDFLICSFGFVAETKKTDSIIKNCRDFLTKNNNAKLVFVGEYDNTYGQTMKKMVDNANLTDHVLFTGFIADEDYKKYMSICDVCIQLRTNTRAGTSASVNHALGAGLSTIISDEGPFSDFPDDVVIKLKPQDEKKMSSIISELYVDDKKRMNLSSKAREYAQTHLSRDSCVEKYTLAIQEILNKKDLPVQTESM